MEDHESPKAVAVRANQEDPIVMYLVVREILGMGVGKIAAQCAHASQMLLLKYVRHVSQKLLIAFWDWVGKSFSVWFGSSPDWDCNMADDSWSPSFRDWLTTSFRKVVLKADEKEWVKLKELPNHIIVIDAGLTEIASGSETVIGFLPMRKSQRPREIKRLQVLK
jgi:peptidyl-tRNA hydrolase